VVWPRIKRFLLLVLNQHVWDGQGLKRSLLFWNFSRITKSSREAYFIRDKLYALKR